MKTIHETIERLAAIDVIEANNGYGEWIGNISRDELNELFRQELVEWAYEGQNEYFALSPRGQELLSLRPQPSDAEVATVNAGLGEHLI